MAALRQPGIRKAKAQGLQLHLPVGLGMYGLWELEGALIGVSANPKYTSGTGALQS